MLYTSMPPHIAATLHEAAAYVADCRQNGNCTATGPVAAMWDQHRKQVRFVDINTDELDQDDAAFAEEPERSRRRLAELATSQHYGYVVAVL